MDLEVGALYVFSSVNDFNGEDENRIIGIFDSMQGGCVRLETAWRDMQFVHNYDVPSEYCFYKEASKWDIANFYYNLGCYDTELMYMKGVWGNRLS
ncbi:MAG: hypothetical protein IJC16_09750 [Rikenellaceae bacterium]|nr:hypothetical protein [Rikenellaceae bacterium]